MKIAFPVQEDRGMDSAVYGHFGSAPHFIIVDSDNGAFQAASNPDMHHQHGQCQPIAALSGNPVDAIVVGGIGACKPALACGARAARRASIRAPSASDGSRPPGSRLGLVSTCCRIAHRHVVVPERPPFLRAICGISSTARKPQDDNNLRPSEGGSDPLAIACPNTSARHVCV